MTNDTHRPLAAIDVTFRELPLAQSGRRPQPAFLGTRAAGVILDCIALPVEAELTATLLAPVLPGLTTRAGFDYKEAECRALLDRLSCEQGRALLRRLELARPDDSLVAAFARLTADRRARLRTFVVDAPRRRARDIAQRAA